MTLTNKKAQIPRKEKYKFLLRAFAPIRHLVIFFKSWRRLRKASYLTLQEINDELKPGLKKRNEGEEKKQTTISNKIDWFETLEDLKNANLGKFIANCIIILFFWGAVLLLLSFKRAKTAVIDVNLEVSSISFRSLERFDLDSLCRSASDITFGEVAIEGEKGTANAHWSGREKFLGISFQEIPAVCAYSINQLTSDKLSISCKRFDPANNFSGSLTGYDTVWLDNAEGENRKYIYNNMSLLFERGTLSSSFSILNSSPESWDIGPIYADSIRFVKFTDESGTTEFSLLRGFIKLQDGEKDSLLLTKLDTLAFELCEPVRLYLSRAKGENIRARFQGKVKKLTAGPRIKGRNNNKMPRRGEIWLNAMPGYLPEVVITGAVSLFLLLLIRQRRIS